MAEGRVSGVKGERGVEGDGSNNTYDTILGPTHRPHRLHHPHSLEGVDGDWGAATLNHHTADPFSKAHLLNEVGNVWTIKYDSIPGINPLMLESKGDLISQMKVEAIDHVE